MVHPDGRTQGERLAAAALRVTAIAVRRNGIDGIVDRGVMAFAAYVNSTATINFRCHDRRFTRVGILGIAFLR